MLKKTFHLPLLAALPLALAACGPNVDDIDLDGYRRTGYRSQAECQRAYAQQIRSGLENPCQKMTSSGGRVMYFGPYFRSRGGNTTYLGYTGSGKVSSSGATFNRTGTYVGRASAPTVSRGGFSSSARAGGSSFGG